MKCREIFSSTTKLCRVASTTKLCKVAIKDCNQSKIATQHSIAIYFVRAAIGCNLLASLPACFAGRLAGNATLHNFVVLENRCQCLPASFAGRLARRLQPKGKAINLYHLDILTITCLLRIYSA